MTKQEDLDREWGEFLIYAIDFYIELSEVATKVANVYGPSGSPEVFNRVMDKGPDFLDLYKYWKSGKDEQRKIHLS